MVPETLERSAKVQVLADRARKLSSITEHENWPELRAEFERKKERMLRSLALRLATDKPVDQRECDFMRGFFAGAKWLLDNPDQAEAALEKALEEAVRTKERERV